MSKHTLNLTQSGSRVVVKSISPGNHELAHRLLSLGIVEGTIIEVKKAAPFGDPIRIKALGYELSLRLSEAEFVEVSPL